MSVFDEPSRRNQLGVRLLKNDRSKKLLHKLYEVVSLARSSRGMRGFGNQENNIKDYIEQIIADLYASWLSDASIYTGYSRSSSAFSSKGAYKDIGKDNFLFIIDSLAEAGLIESHIQDPGLKQKSSRMRCTSKLAQLIEDNDLNWASIIRDPIMNTIVLKSAKDSSKNAVSVPFNDSDDERIPGMRERLESINTKLSRTLLNLFVPDEDERKINEKLRGDPDEVSLDFTRRHLFRVFNNNSWDEGGRFYGGWWQGLPKQYRPHIQIEGKMTVEWDYSSIHPMILYAQAGDQMPADAYAIPGWEEEYRTLIKLAFQQLVNCAPATRSKGRWRTLAPDLIPEPEPVEWNELKKYEKAKLSRIEFTRITGRDYSILLNDIIEYHKPIQNRFFTRAWSSLQYTDAEIAEEVMVRLYEQDIIVLPIHDSFIVRRGFEGYLKKTMREVFEEKINVKPGMKINLGEGEDSNPETATKDVLSGDDMMKMIRDTEGKYIKYQTRQYQWKQQWGLEGWD